MLVPLPALRLLQTQMTLSSSGANVDRKLDTQTRISKQLSMTKRYEVEVMSTFLARVLDFLGL